MRFNTLAIHTGDRLDRQYGATLLSIYQISTFDFADVDKTRDYNYSRSANLTQKTDDVEIDQGIA